MRLGKWKLRLTDKGPELYNLEADIAEHNDTADKKPRIVKRLTKMIRKFDIDLKAHQRPAGVEGGGEGERGGC